MTVNQTEVRGGAVWINRTPLTNRHSCCVIKLSHCLLYKTFLCVLKCVFVCVLYLLHSEGADHVLRQQLSLDQCHLHVAVDLCVVRPVLTTFHLRVRAHTHTHTHTHTDINSCLFIHIKLKQE